MKDYNANLRRLVKVADEMIAVADRGHDQCRDDNCVSLFGLAKDCAYRVRTAAETEFASHKARELEEKQQQERV